MATAQPNKRDEQERTGEWMTKSQHPPAVESLGNSNSMKASSEGNMMEMLRTIPPAKMLGKTWRINEAADDVFFRIVSLSIFFFLTQISVGCVHDARVFVKKVFFYSVYFS